MDKTLFANINKEVKRDSQATEALKRALKPLDKENKLGARPYDKVEIKVIKEAPKMPAVEEEKGFSEEPMKNNPVTDPFMDGVYEFFSFNPWDGHGQRKQKINEIADYLKNVGHDTRGKAIMALTKLTSKLGSTDLFTSKVDQVYKYIRLKLAAKDLQLETKAYESSSRI